MALREVGVEKVLSTVGMEPSGEAFNELSLDGGTHRPVNPMINAGAIAVNQLINGEDSSVAARVGVLLGYFSRLAGRELRIDERVTGSELATADRNLALAHMLRSYGVIGDSAQDAVTGYVRQCSILVTVKDLAVMGATLALGGRQPVTGEQVLDPRVCRQVQAVMASAGMYDGAGKWMAGVGIPAKSGVAGGLMGTLPGQLGIATFSPRLDASGNSVRGTEIFRRMSEDMGLHLMSAVPARGSAVRSIRQRGLGTVIRLQGGLGFAGAEDFLATVAGRELKTNRVVVDMRRVTDVDGFGRAMVLEGLRRIREDGHRIGVIDPDGLLGKPNGYTSRADFEDSESGELRGIVEVFPDNASATLRLTSLATLEKSGDTASEQRYRYDNVLLRLPAAFSAEKCLAYEESLRRVLGLAG